MSNQVNKYSSDFKLKVVLKYLSEKRTCSQICSEFQISNATLHKWVKQFKERNHLIFDNSSLSGIGNKKKGARQLYHPFSHLKWIFSKQF